jgi:predicted glycosyltransferase
VKVSLVVHKFKEHTSICTTRDKREVLQMVETMGLVASSLEHYGLVGTYLHENFFSMARYIKNYYALLQSFSDSVHKNNMIASAVTNALVYLVLIR